MVTRNIRNGDFVRYDFPYSYLKTGKVVAIFGNVGKVKTRDGDIFTCSAKGLKKISKSESENRDALTKLRA